MSAPAVEREREPFIEHCPHCTSRADLRPVHQMMLPPDGAECLYRCPACFYSWKTSWSTDGEDPRFLWTGRR